MEEATMRDIRDRVRLVLSRYGRPQRDFAAAIGLEPSKLSKALHGSRRFTPGELVRIADVGGVSVAWLLHGTERREGVVLPPGTVPVPGTPRPPPLEHPAESGPSPRRNPPAGHRPGDRRQQIIEATWRLIAEHGYRSVRVSDVARLCGTSTSTIHYHFPTVRDLLTEALRTSLRHSVDRQAPILDGIEDLHERLLYLIELQLPLPGQFTLEWSLWIQLWTEATLDPELRAVHADIYRRWHETIRCTLREGQSHGVFTDFDPEDMTMRLTAYIDGLGIQVLTEVPGRTVDTMRRDLHMFVARDILRG